MENEFIQIWINEEFVFSHKRDCQTHPPLFFNNMEVKQVNEHKHLGLGIGVNKYLSSFVPVKTLGQFCKMYVRPHLDFVTLFITHQWSLICLFSRFG